MISRDTLSIKRVLSAASLAGAALFWLSGCATYQSEVFEARSALSADNPARAVTLLEPLAKKDNRDQLVFLLDYATALQQSKRFKDSAQAFQDAAKIADIQDYHSISKITSSLLLSEEMVQYKGDDYEKVLIHAMNAVNYLELDLLDDALVEVKQLNLMLYKFKYEAKKNYEQNPYAFYLSALIYEAEGQWDDAYIAYKGAYEVAPNYEPLKADLIRSAQLAQNPEDVAKWKATFKNVKPQPIDKKAAEIVMIFEQGWGPRKTPRPESPRFPELIRVSSTTKKARLNVGGAVVDSTPIFDVSSVAIKTLNDDFARLVAMRVAGVATKAVVADQLRQKNGALGTIAWIAMNVSDRADLRQWSTLPDSFQIARMSVAPGTYTVSSQGLDYYGNPTNEKMPDREVTVRPGHKVFVSWRSVR